MVSLIAQILSGTSMVLASKTYQKGLSEKINFTCPCCTIKKFESEVIGEVNCVKIKEQVLADLHSVLPSMTENVLSKGFQTYAEKSHEQRNFTLSTLAIEEEKHVIVIEDYENK